MLDIGNHQGPGLCLSDGVTAAYHITRNNNKQANESGPRRDQC